MNHPELGTFVWCPSPSCVQGEWSAKAEERGWMRIPDSEKFLCPVHRTDSYESVTGHEITCLTGAGMPCDCERPSVQITVQCSRCGFRHTDPLVANEEQCLSVVRGRLTGYMGWAHSKHENEYTGLCHVCARGIYVNASGDTDVKVTIEDYDFLDNSAEVLEFGLSRERLVHLHEEIGRYLYGADTTGLIE